MRLLDSTDFRQMPWANGGGNTCELLRLPHPRQAERFALRLSIATVAQGGPFSRFEGIDRHLLLLDGAGMALRFAGEEQEVVLDQALQAPIRFAGETAVQCRLLGGSLRDFNPMTARDCGASSVDLMQLGAGQTCTLAGTALLSLYLVQGLLQFSTDVEPQAMHAGQLLHGQRPLTLQACEACLLICCRTTLQTTL